MQATPPLWRVLSEFGYFIGLAAAIGFALTYLIALRPATTEAEPADRSALRRRACLLLASAGPVLLVAAYFQLAGRVARAAHPVPFAAALAPSRIGEFLTAAAKPGAWTSTGTVYLVQNACYVLAAGLLIALFHHGVPSGPVVRCAVGSAMLGSLAGAVPANLAKETGDDLLNSALDQLHILGGMSWVGGLAFLLAMAGVRGRLGPRAGVIWSAIWRRFSNLALVSVGCVLISGLWLSWKHVGAVSQLLTTTFGQFLLVKLFLVLGMISSGAVNQLWLIPRVMRAKAAGATGSLFTITLRSFPKVITVEVLLACGVLAIVPFLSGSARTQAGEAVATPPAGGSVLLVGLILIAMVIASFIATARTSTALGNRTSPAQQG